LSRPKYSRLTIPRKARDDSLVGILSLHGPLGFLEESGDLVAFFREAGSARAAAETLSLRLIRFRLVTDIPEGDPLEAYRAASRPFLVGRRLWIDPGDSPYSAPPAGRIALRLPASRAFGTGGHESTRLALEALQEEALEGRRVLDAGTGSGVLALAAVALGAEGAIGFDTDAEAVFVAREHVRRHAFGSRVRLYAGPAEALRAEFAVVAANLLPEEFLPARRALLPKVAPGGRLIVSGIPIAREQELSASLRSRRWRLLDRREENRWTCLSFGRAS
jgi:ribosomal protein L11 methyltransferase